MINQVLDAETPDLVILNGDLITGENAFLENSTIYVDQIVAPLLERNLSWASTYGNHDSQYNLSRVDILAREKMWPNARTTNMLGSDAAGVSNYYLPVYSSSCAAADDPTLTADEVADACVPALILWFFDSRGGFKFQQLDAEGNQVPEATWVDDSVVQWYKETEAALLAKYSAAVPRARCSQGQTKLILPSLGFVHIPTYASYLLQTQAGLGIDAAREPGINDDYPLAPQTEYWCAGNVYDATATCAYAGQDRAFMEAVAAAASPVSGPVAGQLVSAGGMAALFSGHDHGDTWCYKWNDELTSALDGLDGLDGNGLNLCFGQHSGYGGYGSWIRGARQVLVNETQLQAAAASYSRPSVDTWIRLESGDIVGSVSLNATYGTDVYPVTPDDTTSCPTC